MGILYSDTVNIPKIFKLLHHLELKNRKFAEEGARLKKIRQHLKLNQTYFTQLLDRTQGSYPQVESGQKSISFRFMKKLITEFRVNPNYIYLGQLPMFIDDNQSEAVQSALEERFHKMQQELDSMQAANGKLKARLAKKNEHIKKLEEKVKVLKGRLGE